MVEWSFYGRGIRALFNNISWSVCVHAGGCWMRRSVTLASRVLSNFPGAPLLDRRTLTMNQSLYIALTIFHRILVFPNPFKAYRHTFQLSRYVISVRWDYGVRWWLKLCDFDVIHLGWLWCYTLGWWGLFCRYGDKTPKSFISRLFSVIWIMTGITVCSLLTATLSSALTNEQVDYYGVLSGKKVELNQL